MKVRVVGAGFSGLATAYSLSKKGCEVEVYEKTARAGGLLTSRRSDWALIEGAANGIRASQKVVEMFEDINLKYLTMKSGTRKRFIFRGKPKQLPLTALEFTRMSAGFFRRPQPRMGQTVESYAEAVFGYGAAHFLVEPALFGIFAEKSNQLSAKLVYDYFFKYRTKKSTKARGTLAPKDGMSELVKSLVNYIESKGGQIHYNQEVEINQAVPTVIATDAHTASDLLTQTDEWVSDKLKTIEYVPLSSVTLGFKKSHRSLEGFGCLFPSAEDFHSLGVLFNNCIFDHRGPFETETWMIRGTDFTDEQIRNMVLKDRQRMTNLNEEPDEISITRWPKALPLYSSQLEKILQELVLPQNIYLAGNYLGRMGLAKILEQCHDTADRILKNES